MNLPLVEVLLATYNGEDFLEDQIFSILNQTYQEFKLLVRDDGSKDNTSSILDNYVEKNPKKIRLVRGEASRQGVIGNFSSLIASSSASYLMFCDQDDIWFPEKIEKLLDIIQRIEEERGSDLPVLVHSDLTVVSSDLKVLNRSLMNFSGFKPTRTFLNNLLVQNVVTGASCIFNRSLARLASPIPAEALMHDWWVALIAGCIGVVEYFPESTGYYRQHQENVLGARSFNLAYIWDRFLRLVSTEGRGILDSNILQSQSLLEKLDGKLEEDQRLLLEEFASLNEKSHFEKKRSLLQNKFLKGTLVQNIGLFLRA